MSYRAFWQRRCRAAAAGAVLKPQGGNCAVLPKIFLAELFLAAAAGTANIAVCRNIDENCWVIRDVAACIVSIGMAVDHKNVFAAAFGANVGIFMGEAHSFLRYIVTDSCAAADQILEKAGKCLKSSHRPPA